jgi:2,3-bisphosphoglycerate-independent phosphoglycerate mutase
MDALYKDSKGYTELEASSLAVGLPEGLMGNSEVGHLNIGAGRVVWQDVVRIDQTIKNGELSQNDVIKKTFQSAAAGNGRLHLCGLVSHGGVVSQIMGRSFRSSECLPVTYDTTARQANPPLRPPQGC